jgi:hypothetical protein
VALADEPTEISLYLDPTEENSDWYSKNVTDGTARGDIISDNLLQDFRDLQKKYSILNYVPYNTFTYTINYENGCAENNNGLCLVIDADFGYRRYAVQYLQSKQQDLSDFYVKIKNHKLPFKQIELSVPENLSFEGEISGVNMSSADASEVARVANNYIKQSFDLNGYTAKVGQIKKYDDVFFGVILMVYSGSESAEYDIYRMIVGLVDGEYRVITNADIVLSKYKNPLVPEELLRLVDSF